MIDAALAPRRAGGVRRLGRDGDDAAGALDAGAGGAARVVGLLVHADPAGVPDRPRRRRGGVRARQPADAAPGPLAGGAAPGDRRRGRARPTCSPTRCPYVFTWLLQSSSFGVDAILVCQFVLACITVLPATLLMGGVFPLTVRMATGGLDSVGHDVGNAYALNTVGAIVGSFLSGFVVLPRLGLQRASTSPCCSIWRWRRCCSWRRPGCRAGAGGRASPPRSRWRCSAWCCRAGIWSASRRASSACRSRASTSTARSTSAAGRRPSWSSTRTAWPPPSASISWDKTYSLKNNGKVDASNDADMPTQIIVGLLPLLFYSQPHAAQGGAGRLRLGRHRRRDHPVPDRVAGGRRAGAGRLPRPRASSTNDNHRPLQNPKVTARVGDGRNFLTQRSDKFDVIVSEPSNPWLTGVSNLFTREYFQQRQDAPRRRTASSASGRSSTRWRPGTSRRSIGTRARRVPVRLRLRRRGLSSDTDPDRQHGAAAAGLSTSSSARSAIRSTRAEARRGGLPVAARRVRLPAARPRGAGVVHRRARPSTPTTTRASSSRRRAICSATPSSIPYLAKVYGPMWPYGRLTELVRGYDDGPEQSGALRPRWRAACWRTARRARRSCGPGAPRPPATRPRRSTRGCC